jgi:hypothetical protein
MRLVASILMCAVALTAGAAEIWRWRDANGVVHYSDQPRPGAERISVVTAAPGSVAPTAAPDEGAADRPEGSSGESGDRPPQSPTYTSCTVTAPAHDETFHGVQAVGVSLSVEPELQQGHRIQLFVNGAALPDWPATATYYTLPDVVRGSHTLSVRIVDARGRPGCSGPSITFHLRQQSVIRPARPAPSGA